MTNEMNKTSKRAAIRQLALLTALLILGTQIPGSWRDMVFRVTHLPWQMSKVALFSLFASIATAARVRPLRISIQRVVLMTLGLALMTEGLQNFVLGRDATWRDVGINMAGATLGLLMTRLLASRGTCASLKSIKNVGV